MNPAPSEAAAKRMLYAVLERVVPQKMAAARRAEEIAARENKASESGAAQLRADVSIAPWLAQLLHRLELRAWFDAWRADPAAKAADVDAVCEKLAGLSRRELEGLGTTLFRWLPSRELREAFRHAAAHNEPATIGRIAELLRLTPLR